ncbi:hypothetical protein J19TS2_61240 [Cohnella xylanilytica]|uniref:class D sortase n=1 Tax=Cohnella xylanilytica TaxID=557555 RepID=UPI001B15CCA3|nr:class D sortase [Cohnella xylanilytica]GIO16569.1 hypothetical protein J19TS2_61240 [Cohnella xylanilytica]
MRKKAGTLMILLGAIVIALAVFQFFEYRIQTKQALTEARTLIEPSPNGHIPAMVQVASPDPRRDALAGRQKFKPEESDVLGVLEIPKIKAELPMIEGTDEEMLDRGVGHYSASALPLDGEQILLSGHRDTVFRNFAKLELGDRFIVKLPYGTFEYEISSTEIVDKDDTSVIRSMGKEVLVVTTCYPFRYVGPAPQRYVVYADPVSSEG